MRTNESMWKVPACFEQMVF